MKKDAYSRARGGWSRILEIKCSKCNHLICHYQKDGPGPLKRMYLDRIINGPNKSTKLVCASCGEIIGSYYIYPKENRPAYHLQLGSVSKKIISAKSL